MSIHEQTVVAQRTGAASERAVEQLVMFLRCRTAEEYFAALDVGYDPGVLAANRVPILRTFSAELARIERPAADRAHPGQEGPSYPSRLDPLTRVCLYRDALRRSYLAFAYRGDVPDAFVGVDEIMIERPLEGQQ